MLAKAAPSAVSAAGRGWADDPELRSLLDARQRLLEAGESDPASSLSERICARLRADGHLGQAAALGQATLDAMPAPSVSRARWLHELGAIAQAGGDDTEARRWYLLAVDMYARVGHAAGVARCYESLGAAAHASGDYQRAERHYQAAACFREPSATWRCPGSRPGGDEARPAPETPPAPPEQLLPEQSDQPLPDQPLPDQLLAAPEPTGGPWEPSPPPEAAAAREPTAPSGPAAPWEPVAPPEPVLPTMAAAPWEPATLPLAVSPPLGADWPVTAGSPGDCTGPLVVMRDCASGADGPRHSRRGRRDSDGWPGGRQAYARRPVVALAAGSLVLAAGVAVVRGAASGPAGNVAAGTYLARGSPAEGGSPAAARDRRRAAAWVARQAGPDAVVGCDPAMCADLRAAGVPAGSMLLIGPGGQADPLGSTVVVATAAIRGMLGGRLAGVYAPLVLARFGTGSARIEVRVTAPGGAAAYARALAADQTARRAAGLQIIGNGRLAENPAARAALADGQVDARLLTTIAALAPGGRLRILRFVPAGPGASPAVPLGGAEITVVGRGGAPLTPAASRLAQRGSRVPPSAATALPGQRHFRGPDRGRAAGAAGRVRRARSARPAGRVLVARRAGAAGPVRRVLSPARLRRGAVLDG